MNLKSSICYLLLLILPVAGGCDLFNSGDADTIAAVEAGRAQYELSNESVIDLSIENRSSNTIYFSTCDRFTLEELENNEVIQSRVIEMSCECLCIVAVGSADPAGTSSFDINGYYIAQNRDGLRLNTEVRYRILPHFYSDSKLTDRLSLDAVESDLFILTDPD